MAQKRVIGSAIGLKTSRIPVYQEKQRSGGLLPSMIRKKAKVKIVLLSSLLPGGELKAVRSISDQQQNYDSLKNSLLKRYRCTEDGFHDRLKSALHQASEDFDTFVDRLEKLIDSWFELAQVGDNNFDQLHDWCCEIKSTFHASRTWLNSSKRENMGCPQRRKEC